MQKLFLLDAYALIFRAYYAFIGRPMRNSAGLNTSAIFGFTKFLRDIIIREKPHYLGVAFDPRGGNFRHELYAEYKANRAETPEDIILSVPYIKRILEAMRIPILEIAGWEADDVIGTLSVEAAAQGFDTYMVTPDKDYGQLVSDHAFIYKQSKSEGVEIVDKKAIEAHYNVADPRLVADILALWGDVADNVPGISGIGEKGAIKLVSQWGSVENILENVSKISGRVGENIAANSEWLLMAKKLVTIDTSVPIDFVPAELEMADPDCPALLEVYKELDFSMFIREMATDSRSPFNSAILCKGTIQTELNAYVKDDVNAYVNTSANTYAQQDLFSAAQSDNITTVEHEYRLVESDDELKKIVVQIAESTEFCYDTETTGYDCFGDRMVGISLATEPHKAFYVPLLPENMRARLDILRPVFENEKIAKIGQNIKFDDRFMAAAGVEVRGPKCDTMIMHYLLDAESRHGMNHLAHKYLDYTPIEISSLIGTGTKALTMDQVAVEKVAEYAAEDADVTLQLCRILRPKVTEQGFEKLYKEIEEPLIGVLERMETAGVRIDTKILADYAKELILRLEELETKIRELTEEPELNVNSARQLGDVLFGKMRLVAKPKMTKTRQYSTDEETLQGIVDRHPVVAMVLEYRGVKKLLSTYVEALPGLVNPHTGKVHTSYNQAVTATGRLSSTNPNLQNIPIREEQGRKIREAFVPSDSDHVLLSADYSQVELRLMAHLSKDEALIEAFCNKEDIHQATAARIFGVPLELVTPEMRRRAKTANFGIIYGISAFGLSQRLNIPRSEAADIIEGYFRSYPGVKDYMDRVVKEAQGKGYVETIFGRRRYLPDIGSRNAVARGLAERNAVNAPIQGSAADIMKIAMINIDSELRRQNLNSKMILQVHDEVVVDMLRTEQAAVEKIVVEAMQGAAKLDVALVVDFGVGDNWLAAH